MVAGIADRCVEPVDHYKIFPQRRAPNNSLSGSQFCSVSFTVLISQRQVPKNSRCGYPWVEWLQLGLFKKIKPLRTVLFILWVVEGG